MGILSWIWAGRTGGYLNTGIDTFVYTYSFLYVLGGTSHKCKFWKTNCSFLVSIINVVNHGFSLCYSYHLRLCAVQDSGILGINISRCW